PDLAADRLARLGADGGREAREVAPRSFGQPRPEVVSQEGEAGVLRLARTVRVRTEHDFGLGRMQLETNGLEPLGDRSPQLRCLGLGVAVDDDVVCVALERTARMLPVHPTVE